MSGHAPEASQRSAQIDFVISNDRHHVATALPVARHLAGELGRACRLVSLCELRGIATPARVCAEFPTVRVVPRHLRASPSTGASGSLSRGRDLLRRLAWTTLIGHRMRRVLAERPGVCVLPNDIAFPYDRIASLLLRRGIPFLLLQEGVRFPLPAESREARYGCNGATAVAAWGAASAEHFRAVGVPERRIYLTGSPRFDALAAPDCETEGRALAATLGLPRRFVLLVSNPIDDQGYCSTDDKLRLIARFVASTAHVLLASGAGLVVKLHARESASAFRGALTSATPLEIPVLGDVPLHPLLAAADAVVILASTVGLETILLGTPLGVLEIPGAGFVFDYVAAGAARGLTWSSPMAPQTLALLADPPPSAAAAYLAHHLALRSGAARAAAELVESLARGR